jgi:subtilisin family serine protease
MRLSVKLRVLAAVLGSSVVILLSGSLAWAGRLHPDLDAQLKALPPGGTVAVIVEMFDQADPAAAAATSPHGQRHLRTQAVVDALRDLANQRQGPVRALLAREQAQGNVRRVIPFWVFNGLGVTATEPVIRRLAARADVWEIRPDAEIPAPPIVQPTATPGPAASNSVWNLDKIRAPEVWALDPAYAGSGQVVGSFDTGVDVSHPDLQPRYRGNHAISWYDPYGEHLIPFDFNGHGTHTTGTAVGGDASGVNIGVAPGAQWIAAKAWNDAGIGLASVFHLIFQWFLAPGGNSANAPDVVNSSWAFAAGGCIGEFAADILALRAAGIFPSFAAGNDGPAAGSVRSPGASPDAFAAGATDINDAIASFSARGPSPCGGPVKPDVSAPGVAVFSAYPGGYLSANGTSMAAPHVSGAVAVLRSINSALTVDELETLLVLGGVDLGVAGADDTFGNGRLDLFTSAQILLGGLNRPIVSIAATDSAAAETGHTTATFTLTRTGPTDAPLVVRYTVSGTATAGSDYVGLPGSATFPVGSATASLVVSVIDDTIPEGVETVIVTVAPDSAYLVGTPSRATATIVSDEAPPDLIVSVLSAPSAASTLSAFTVTATAKNQGALPAGATTLKFYLSTKAAFDASATLLGSREIAPLGVGVSSSGATALNIPVGKPSGMYFLIARADADDVVVEGDEANNTQAVQLQVRVEVIVGPSAIDLATPPAAFTITGNGFANVGFGLPVINFVRGTTLLAQARATALTGATTLTVPFPTSATSLTPNVPGLSAGVVEVQVWLQTGGGSYSPLGTGPLTVSDTRPTPGVSAIAPSSIDLATPPVSFTITGNGFANLGFGLPVINFVAGTTLLAQGRATALTGGTTLTVPFPTSATSLTPNLPGLSTGAVQVQVYVATGSASYILIGSVTLTVADTRPAAGVHAIDPSTIDLAAAPATFTITGGGFANLGFGLPVINFVRGSVFLAQSRVTALTPTTLTVPFPTAATSLTPNLPGLSAGTVQVQVYAATGSASYTLIGSLTLTVADTRQVQRITAITPSAIDLATPPAAFTITGSGLANVGFGLPVVNFLRNGALVAQARASALTAGTTLTVPFPTAATSLTPNLPGLSAGTIDVQVWLPTGGSSYSLIGNLTLTVADTRPAPGVSGITPNPVDLAEPPATFTITGGGFENFGFGLPVINFLRGGALLGQARATAVTGGAALTVPFPTSATSLTPNLPGLSVGSVDVQVWLQTGAGSYRLLGSAPLMVR